jgi:hypothetical protein
MKIGRSPTNRRFEVSRRRLIAGLGAAGGLLLGPGLPKTAFAIDGDDDSESRGDVDPNPIPGGVAPLKPFGIFIHHTPPSPTVPLAKIHDPSNITDFDGFVGFTRLRGTGTGKDTKTGETMPLAYQVDMGFNQGKFIDTDGRKHRGTFVFV